MKKLKKQILETIKLSLNTRWCPKCKASYPMKYFDKHECSGMKKLKTIGWAIYEEDAKYPTIIFDTKLDAQLAIKVREMEVYNPKIIKVKIIEV